MMRPIFALRSIPQHAIRNTALLWNGYDEHGGGVPAVLRREPLASRIGVGSGIDAMAHGGDPAAAAGAVPRAGGDHAARPVSYTHLRAHETPEHLVCRL